MKNFLKTIYIFLFMLIGFLPMLMYGVQLYSGDGTEEYSIEKSKTLEFPSVFNSDGINMDFDDEFEGWINQNIPFRGHVVSFIDRIFSTLLKDPVANVVTGKKGWLYSEETIDNYLDTNPLSNAEIQNIAITLSLIQERVEAQGGNFVFVPVPNKNSIYPEYMPVRYIRANSNNLSRLCEELDEQGVNYADIKGKLLAAKDEMNTFDLYYKGDTHWTNLGARVGYNTIMEGLNKTSITYDLYKLTKAQTKRGDLDKLLYPVGGNTEEEYIYSDLIDCQSFEFTYPTGITDTEACLDNFMSDREDHDNNFTTRKKEEYDGSSLYMVRDSFGRALLPYMIGSFDVATFVRSTAPDFENHLDAGNVVYEICERNLKNIICAGPFLFAPRRNNIEADLPTYQSENNLCDYSDEGYAIKVYGTIDRDMLGQDGRIYVKLWPKGATDDSVFYEAFPIYEESLGSTGPETCGFTLFLDRNELPSTDINVAVLSGQYVSDTLCSFFLETDGDTESSNLSEDDNTDNQILDIQDIDSSRNDCHKIIYRGTTFGIGDNADDILSGLGSQAAPQEIITSCLSGEDARVISYPFITIETSMDGNIYYVSIMDNSYPEDGQPAGTVAGISLGSSRSDVLEKLGEPFEEKYSMDVYHTECSTVAYSYVDSKLVSIIMEDNQYEGGTGGEEPTVEMEDSEKADGLDTGEAGKENIDNVSTEENNAEEICVQRDSEAQNETMSIAPGTPQTYLPDGVDPKNTGWQIVDGQYFFYDRITGVRVVGQVVDGIAIGANGEVNPSEYEKNKIATMMKAHAFMVQVTEPTDSMEEKRKKVFDWVLSFPYHRYRKLRDVYTEEGIEIIEANDIFDQGAGDCVSESAALAFLFHEIGYKNVYWVHDTGHSWVRSDDRLFDPLFAEGRDYNANYDASFTDYRSSMSHSMLIY